MRVFLYVVYDSFYAEWLSVIFLVLNVIGPVLSVIVRMFSVGVPMFNMRIFWVQE